MAKDQVVRNLHHNTPSTSLTHHISPKLDAIDVKYICRSINQVIKLEVLTVRLTARSLYKSFSKAHKFPPRPGLGTTIAHADAEAQAQAQEPQEQEQVGEVQVGNVNSANSPVVVS